MGIQTQKLNVDRDLCGSGCIKKFHGVPNQSINQSIKQSIRQKNFIIRESMFVFVYILYCFLFNKHHFIFVYFFFNNTFGTEVWLHGHCILFNLTELCESVLNICRMSSFFVVCFLIFTGQR